MGPYYHTHNYSSLPIHYVDRDHFKKNYVDRARRRHPGERTKAEDKVLSPMCWAGLCMGPLVAGRKCWEKEDWSLSLPKNNID